MIREEKSNKWMEKLKNIDKEQIGKTTEEKRRQIKT